MTNGKLDAAREGAVREAERAEARAKRALTIAAVFEAVVFVAILFVIDFSDSTHLLVFLAACLVYGPLALGLLALRSYIDMSTHRVLSSLEASGPN